MNPIAVLTPEDLTRLVREAVREELACAQPRNDESEVLTLDEAAALLGLHTAVVVRHVRRDGLPGYKLGPLWRFRRSEIMAWLGAKKKTGGGLTG